MRAARNRAQQLGERDRFHGVASSVASRVEPPSGRGEPTWQPHARGKVAALADLSLMAGDPERALATLEAHPPADAIGGEVVAFHRCRLLAAAGEVAKSLEEAEALPERERWELKAIVARHRQDGSHENLLAVLDAAYAATGELGYLLEAAERRGAAINSTLESMPRAMAAAGPIAGPILACQ